MKFFIDTANLEEIKEINSWGILSGVTTNPSLIAKEGKVFEDVVMEISKIVDDPISAEVIALDYENMVKQAIDLSKIHKNIVVKIPMTKDGLKAVSILSKEGIKTNVTLIFSVNQALLAARAGANYVSPFIGRLDDIGHDGLSLIKELTKVFETYSIDTEIIAASIRNTSHVYECIKSGVDIATIPYKVFNQLLNHPLTTSGIDKFLKDFGNVETKGEF